MTLKRRIERLESPEGAQAEPVFAWKGQPEPDGLKPGQEVIWLRWRDERDTAQRETPSS